MVLALESNPLRQQGNTPVFRRSHALVHAAVSKTSGLSVSDTNTFPDSGADTASPVDASGGSQQLGVPVAGAGTEVAPRLIRISDTPVAVGASVYFMPGKVATTSVGTTTATTEQ